MTAGNDATSGRLLRVREAVGATQPAFAARCGVSLRSYQDYESGKRLPGPEFLQAASSSGVNLNWPLAGNGSMLTDESEEANSQTFRAATNELLMGRPTDGIIAAQQVRHCGP